MEFEDTITILNRLLKKKQPDRFSPMWVYQHCPAVYRFIWKNVRTEFGIDWDRVTVALKPEFQKLWAGGRKRPTRKYYNTPEVRKVLKKHRHKLYTFVSSLDWDDKCARDVICIALVRLAQNGNVRAKQQLIKLLTYTVEGWIEQSPRIFKWRFYPDRIPEQLERCIRCYRYTGSFTRYLFRTLQLAGRGLQPFYTSSLDQNFSFIEKRRIDSVVQDPETQEIRMFGR